MDERGNSPGCINLNDAVEVSDVDPELKGTGGHDDTIASLRERVFGASAFVPSEGTVGDVDLDVLLAQRGCKSLNASATVYKYEALLPSVEPRDYDRRVVDASDIIERNLRGGGFCLWRDDTSTGSAGSQPTEKSFGVANSGRERHTLELPTGKAGNPLEYTLEVPAAVIAAEDMSLVDDDSA